MNNIQELISELKFRKEKAEKKRDKYWNEGREVQGTELDGMVTAFSWCIQKLTLLLNAETQTTVKSKQHDGNAM